VSSYGLILKDIEVDIHILESLINDVHYYREIYNTDVNDPHASAMHRENLQQSVEQYREHKTYLLGRMEEWMVLTLEYKEMPVSLKFYRILYELRDHKKSGI